MERSRPSLPPLSAQIRYQTTAPLLLPVNQNLNLAPPLPPFSEIIFCCPEVFKKNIKKSYAY